MQGSINVAIQTINFFDMALLLKLNRILRKDFKLREKAEKNATLFENYATDELRKIRQEMLIILYYTCIFNGLMLFIYLLPIAISVLLGVFLKDRIKVTIELFTDIPEDESYQLVPIRTENCEIWDRSLQTKRN